MNDNNFAGNSRYAIDFLGNEWKYECMGCAISSGEIKFQVELSMKENIQY